MGENIKNWKYKDKDKKFMPQPQLWQCQKSTVQNDLGNKILNSNVDFKVRK